MLYELSDMHKWSPRKKRTKIYDFTMIFEGEGAIDEVTILGERMFK